MLDQVVGVTAFLFHFMKAVGHAGIFHYCSVVAVVVAVDSRVC